jgi:predicted MPP superfamily phosphohydrolase
VPHPTPSHPDLPALHTERPGRSLYLGDVAGFAIRTLDLPVPELHPALDGLTIVHLSDIHATARWQRGYDELFQRLQTRRPDLLLVTGDFVDPKFDHRPVIPTIRKLALGLQARLGVFAIPGNHDGDLLIPRLHDTGITFLNGRCATLRSSDHATLQLIGLPGGSRDDVAEFAPAALDLPDTPDPDTLRVVLTHYPDTVSIAARFRPVLVLAGHTHGGQICRPTGRPIITHDSLPPHQSSGIHTLHDTTLLVSRGFGFTFLPIRLFCPPEITQITLRTIPSPKR